MSSFPTRHDGRALLILKVSENQRCFHIVILHSVRGLSLQARWPYHGSSYWLHKVIQQHYEVYLIHVWTIWRGSYFILSWDDPWWYSTYLGRGRMCLPVNLSSFLLRIENLYEHSKKISQIATFSMTPIFSLLSTLENTLSWDFYQDSSKDVRCQQMSRMYLTILSIESLWRRTSSSRSTSSVCWDPSFYFLQAAVKTAGQSHMIQMSEP